MVYCGMIECPNCNGELRYYDSVKRIVRTKYGKSRWITIYRLACKECGIIHRELPEYLLPYKHYELDIIMGFSKGILSSENLAFEDYPCQLTIDKWMTMRNLQLI